MVVLICLCEGSWELWNTHWGYWAIQTMLPLHLCNIMMLLACFMLIFKNYRLYEFVYFLGIGAACSALITPNAGIYGFPHFWIIETLLAHGLLLTSAVYMTIIEGFRPNLRSLWKVVVGSNIYMVLISMINWTIGSNYRHITHKPDTPSLLSLLPAWPWYIIWAEIIGLGICLILYLPFVFMDGRLKT